MEGNQELFDSIFRERVLRARRVLPAQRLIEGLKFSDEAVSVLRSGIRQQFPEFSPEQINAELQRRVAIAKRLGAAT